MPTNDQKPVAVNRKARHDYDILETVEAGLVLTGTEVKSIRAGKLQLRDGYALIQHNEAWLENVHISPYDEGGRENVLPLRRRKLLLHRKEIDRLAGKTLERGLTLVPLEVYFNNGKAKVRLGLAKGRREYDKRHAIADREARLEVERSRKTGSVGRARD
jgi:SsrA-binding protein